MTRSAERAALAALLVLAPSVAHAQQNNPDFLPNAETITLQEHVPDVQDLPPEQITCDWYDSADVTLDLVVQYRVALIGNHGWDLCGKWAS